MLIKQEREEGGRGGEKSDDNTAKGQPNEQGGTRAAVLGACRMSATNRDHWIVQCDMRASPPAPEGGGGKPLAKKYMRTNIYKQMFPPHICLSVCLSVCLCLSLSLSLSLTHTHTHAYIKRDRPSNSRRIFSLSLSLSLFWHFHRTRTQQPNEEERLPPSFPRLQPPPPNLARRVPSSLILSSMRLARPALPGSCAASVQQIGSALPFFSSLFLLALGTHYATAAEGHGLVLHCTALHTSIYIR